MHSKNYHHRDIKTANFLVVNEYTIKLGDFGISKLANIDG